jgi:energy-coupling factor transporter ATP-binding protein EcfA2
MISDIDFTNIKDSENFKYAVELDFFKKNTQMQFKPSLNIIYAPNGTGKSTLLKIMAQFTASEQGGVSTITNSWIQDVAGFRESKLKGLSVKHDGQSVMYTNPRQAVGLFGGTAAFDDDFFSEGVAETQLRQSTGLTTLYRMQKILGVITGKAQAPSKIANKGGRLTELTSGFLKASIPEGQKTILLDEPESGLAVHVQANLWKMIEQGAIKHDLQIIVASHSPFALACKANYIELQPGYL